MSRISVIISGCVLSLLFACYSADARKAFVSAPPSSPYVVDLVDEYGRTLQTFFRRGRIYALGLVGQRYSIRVSNPTAKRVEAVISVDGLDVIDGRPANYKNKRGYVIEPYDQLLVDGFRVSMNQVAAFRFSAVADSYAARKGKARNVGVIGVAIFEQRISRPVAVAPRPFPHYRHEEGHSAADRAQPTPAQPSAKSSAKSSAKAPESRSHRRRSQTGYKRDRAGLGTRFGERRSSVTTWTKFERRSKYRPNKIITIRYNDAAGLMAVGIPVPSYDEVTIRETADPFPNYRFAQPPR